METETQTTETSTTATETAASTQQAATETTTDTGGIQLPKSFWESMGAPTDDIGSEAVDLGLGDDKGDLGKGENDTDSPATSNFDDEFSKQFEGKYKSPKELKEYLASIKSFDDELAEKTGGKYKSFDDLKAEIEAEKVQFANDKIKFLNELAKQGVDVNDEFIAEINRDYESMTDNYKILFEGLKKVNKDWSNEEIDYEIKNRYRMEEWKDEDEQEPSEIGKIMRSKMEREAKATKEKLIADRDALKYVPEKDPDFEKKIQKQKEAYEKYIDTDVLGKLSKISAPISFDEKTKEVKETFDYTIDTNIKGEVAKIMKDMGDDVSSFWKRYLDKNGKYDLNRISTDITKLLSFDEAVRLASETYLNKGREKEIRGIKNTNFDPNTKPMKAGEKTWESAIADSFMKNLKR